MKTTLQFLLASLLALVAGAAAAGISLPGPLVETQWLADHRDAVLVLDVRTDVKSYLGKPEYETDKKTGKKVLVESAGHIPGAVLVNYKDVRTKRVIGGLELSSMIPERADFEKRARAWGVKQDSVLVLAAQGGSTAELNEAARLYWQFKYYGFDHVAVLNGGTTAWLAEERPFESAPVSVAAGDWEAGKGRNEMLATSEDLAAAITDSGAEVVDARSLDQYYGLSKSSSVKAGGHVERARIYPPELVTRHAGGAARYLSRDAYLALLKAQGIRADVPTVTYCNTGHLAAGTWFALSEVMGNKQVKLYDGSMHQWTNEKRPVIMPAGL